MRLVVNYVLGGVGRGERGDVPVCMLTKQLHVLKTAESRRPVTKQFRISMASLHVVVSSSEKYSRVRENNRGRCALDVLPLASEPSSRLGIDIKQIFRITEGKIFWLIMICELNKTDFLLA